MTRYRILARSLLKPGNHLVETSGGECYIYFGDTGQLCTTALDRTFAQAMIQSYEWSAVPDDEWLTLDELETQSGALPTRHAPEISVAQPEA